MYAATGGNDVVLAEYEGRHTIDDPTACHDRLEFSGL